MQSDRVEKPSRLIESYKKGDLEEFTRLLKSGANPNILYSEEHGDSLLHKICKDNKVEFVIALLKNSKFYVDVENSNSESPPRSALQIAKNNSVITQRVWFWPYDIQNIDKAAAEIVKTLEEYINVNYGRKDRHKKRSEYQDKLFSQSHTDNTQAKSNTPDKREFQDDRRYPYLTPQEEDGFTHAQLLVLEGESSLLRIWLDNMPHEVNAICEASSKDNVGKRSLVELALFDNKNLEVNERIKILEIILLKRPFLFSKDIPVDDQINQRMDLEKPDEQLYSIYKCYVISQKTCVPNAIKELSQFMSVLTRLKESLSKTHLKHFVTELEEAIKICDLVSRGYLHGDYTALSGELGKRFNNNTEALSLYANDLIDRAYESLKICTKLNTKTASQQMSSTNETRTESTSLAESHKSLISQYSDMVDTINRILTRYGETVIINGFNEYQRTEISRYISYQRRMHFLEGQHPLRKSK
ncbi:MAG TPA: hypothetical protein VL360_05735 [Gammaproteobacteria bacterium]|nr:hypothetical protein [Gammaproteobacteria bacterium]